MTRAIIRNIVWTWRSQRFIFPRNFWKENQAWSWTSISQTWLRQMITCWLLKPEVDKTTINLELEMLHPSNLKLSLINCLAGVVTTSFYTISFIPIWYKSIQLFHKNWAELRLKWFSIARLHRCWRRILEIAYVGEKFGKLTIN